MAATLSAIIRERRAATPFIERALAIATNSDAPSRMRNRGRIESRLVRPVRPRTAPRQCAAGMGEAGEAASHAHWSAAPSASSGCSFRQRLASHVLLGSPSEVKKLSSPLTYSGRPVMSYTLRT